MSARNLKKPSATDWDRIDKMTDDEIDTSDIPPLDDGFFARAKWRLPRAYIDRMDFLRAKDFAAHILNERLHEKRKTERAQQSRQLVHRALNTALILAYSRPFHLNRNVRGEPKSSLRNCVDEVLNKAESELHSKILAQRDNVFAHSSASSIRIANLDYNSHAAFFHYTENLTKPETTTLKIMIKKWICHMDQKIGKLREIPKN